MPEEPGVTSGAGLEFAPAIASTSSNLTVNTFVNMFKTDTLVLRPPFQRNLVWNDQQQSFLVDSILRGMPVPEIYVQTTTSADGDETTVVVDGQQRITTCLRFVLGELTLTADPEFDARWREKSFDQIHADLKKRFRSFELIVRKMPEMSEAGLREIFRRLNKTVEALEAQELRHAAYTGPLIGLVEQVAAHPVLNDVGVFSARDYQRRRSDEFVAEILYSVYLGAFPNKKEGLDEFFKTFERLEPSSEAMRVLEHRLGRVLEQLDVISGTLRRTRFRNKSDFYSLVVFLAKNAESLPLLGEGAADRFIAEVKDFSQSVNDRKRLEGEADESLPPIEPSDAAVVKYLRAVERAASDRLSRVRRDEALAEVLASLIEDQQSRPLSDSDSAWRTQVVPTDDGGEDDTDSVESRVRAQQALLES